MDNRKRTRGRMRLTKDTSGQMSIDFLAGVAIFTLAFIYVFTFIPGMFTPFQSNSDELTMAADRVSTTLVENVLLVDTAGDDNINRPNVIDARKLSDTLLNTPAGRESLGLSSDRLYNIHVTLTVDQADPDNVVDFGAPYPKGALNVGQSKRIVVIAGGQTGYTITDPELKHIDFSVVAGLSNVGILTVTVW